MESKVFSYVILFTFNLDFLTLHMISINPKTIKTKGEKETKICWKHDGRTGIGSELQKIDDTFQSAASQIVESISQFCLTEPTNHKAAHTMCFYYPGSAYIGYSQHSKFNNSPGCPRKHSRLYIIY